MNLFFHTRFRLVFVIAMFLMWGTFFGCDSADESSDDTDASTDLVSTADDATLAQPSDEQCDTLFGRPAGSTGLSNEECKPSCDCEGVRFEAPVYSESEIAALEGYRLLNQPSELDYDPYGDPQKHPLETDKACGIIFDDVDLDAYRIETFSSPREATEAGALVTHYGACGLCSSLSNLAVYIRNNDLAGPVRQCGLESMLGGKKTNVECLMKIGFDSPCAQIWYFNTKHTREQCLATCLSNLNNPYHKKDGSLNDCIQCDEDRSGQVFKAVSGRTRRNSGLPTALCRPCSSVAPVIHRY